MVSFSLSEDEKLMQNTMRDFALNKISPIARECDEHETVPDDVVNKFWELGYLQSILPEELGGSGIEHSILSGVIVAEELAWGDLSIALHLLTPNLFAIPILHFGTEEQKKKYLPLFTDSTFKPATCAVMEPFMNFDLSSLKTKAYLEGDEYVINGNKCLVPLGEKSDIFIVYATTKEGAGYSGVDGFIIEKGKTGIKKSMREKNLGIKALETIEINFKDCKVPKDNKIGGDSGCNFLQLTDLSKLAISAMAVGVSRAAFEFARDYARERIAFGEPIASRQSIAFMLAEMAIEIDSTRLLTWESAWKIDKKQPSSKEAYLTKMYASDVAMKVTDHAVQILGGHGYIRDNPVEMWMRNARGFSSFEGIAIV